MIVLTPEAGVSCSASRSVANAVTQERIRIEIEFVKSEKVDY